MSSKTKTSILSF